jgi:WD40 repeat protein/tRNA A-37 threonylcarbamoyl transferase component Bud32
MTPQDNPSSREQRVNEVIAGYLEAVEAGLSPDRAGLLALHPDLADELAAFFADRDQFAHAAEQLGPAIPAPCPVPSPVAEVSATSATEAPTLAPGEPAPAAGPLGVIRYFGDYELLEEIARGAMGVVYKARQVSLNRIVAIKMIIAGQFASPTDVERFRAEAEAAANLDHPNIVPIYEVGAHEGQHYFSMKLIEGGSLASFSREPAASAAQRRSAAQLIATVARGVHYAHQRGILHRDLKPANILLDATRQPHVSDFGLARRLDAAGSLSPSGAIIGTPSYMSPEQARASKVLTTATDVHGLGAILYELLTGRPPFRADNVLETLKQVVEQEPQPPRALNRRVDRDLETICLKCLRKEPGERYGSAEALADDLERWLKGEPIQARRIGTVKRVLKWARRKPAIAAMTTAILVAVVLGVAGMAWQWQRAERHLKEAETARDQAKAAVKDARQTLTYSHLALANNAWRAGDTRAALAELNACPPETWGWEFHYLRRLCLASSFTLRGHRDGVNSVCFSPDGGRLASAGADGTARVWDPATGLETRRIKLGRTIEEFFRRESRQESVMCICYSSDGRLLASATADGEVQLTSDPEEGKSTVLGAHEGLAWAVAFSPDGKLLASGGDDNKVRLWDVAKRKELPNLDGQTAIRGLCFSPDGLRLAGAGDDGMIRLWEVRTKQLTRSLDGHKGHVEEVSFSPDGRRLASAGADRTVRIWDVATGRLLLTLGGHNAPVLCVRFSPDGLRLASGGEDQVVRLWDASTGQQLASFRGHISGVNGVSFRPDGQFLASAGSDSSVRLWDCRRTEDGIPLEGLAGKINHACFTPDRSKVIGACSDKTVRIWEAGTGHLLHTLGGHSKDVLRVCVSADGKKLASTQEGQIRVWDIEKGKLVKSADHKYRRGTQGICFTPDGQDVACVVPSGWICALEALIEQDWPRSYGGPDITSAAFAPDGRSIALGEDFVVEIRGLDEQEKAVATLRNPFYVSGTIIQSGTTGPRILFYSSDGRRLAAGYPGGKVAVWDLAEPNPAEGLPLEGHVGGVNGMDFSPDGRRLATAGWDKTVRLWDTRLGTQSLVLQGHHESVLAVSFSADGERLTSISRDGILRQWNGSVKFPVSTWTTAMGLVCSVCFSPDEHLLAWSTVDGFVQISDVPTHRPVGSMRVGDPTSQGVTGFDVDGGREVGRVKKVFFSPDGTRLATITGNKLELWDVQTQERKLTISVDDERSHGIEDACFSPDGTQLAGVTGGGTGLDWNGSAIFLWDSVTGKLIRQFGEEGEQYDSTVCFSPDGNMLITSPGEGANAAFAARLPVSFWDTQTGILIRRHVLDPGPVRSLCLSPDGNHLAGDEGYRERGVRLWRADTGQLEHVLVGHNGDVLSVRYSPDGRWLVSCDTNGEIRMWDTETGKPRPLPTSLPSAKGGRALAVSPSGRWLAYGGPNEGGVTLVDIRVAEEEKQRHKEQSRPDLAWHDRMGRAAAENHHWFGALFHLERVLQSRPGDIDARLRRATALAEMGRWDEAVRDFQHVADKAPDRAEVWRDLALAQRAARQTDASRQTCRRLLSKEHPKNPFAVARCAAVLADGIEDIKQLKPFPELNDPVTRGAVLFRSGKPKEAAEALKDTNDEVGLLFLALAEHGRGRPAEARKALDRLRQLLLNAAADPLAPSPALPWQKRLEVYLLFQEAEALLQGRKP